MSILKLYANLWTLMDPPRSGSEWTLEEKIGAIAAAGFEGVTGAIDARAAELARAHELEPIGWFWATDLAAIDAGVAENARLGVKRVTVFLGQHDTILPEALKLACHLQRQAAAAGLHVAPETHRDTATETPEKMAALLEAYRQQTGEELPVTWDFSHFALVKHVAPDSWVERLLTEPKNIARSELFHFRPFNGHHAQVPAPVGRGAQPSPEYAEALRFFGEVMRRWRAAQDDAAPAREMWVCPEVGPVVAGYALSGEAEPWAQAQVVARDLRTVWGSVESRTVILQQELE